MESSKETDVTSRLIIDLILAVLSTLPSICLELFAQPFRRGFFCNDESISYPHLEETVPDWLLVAAGGGIPVAIIIIIEVIIHTNGTKCFNGNRLCGKSVSSLLVSLYCGLGYFLFGLSITQAATNISKYSVGRLRPHFLAVCEPDYSQFNCSGPNNVPRYVNDYVCTGDEKATERARRSHVSGHASTAMYAAVFITMYMYARITWRGSFLLVQTLSSVCMYVAVYTCYTRISDYQHHYDDVLFGGILGTLIAGAMGLQLLNLYRPVHTSPQSHSNPPNEMFQPITGPQTNPAFFSS